MRTVIEKYTCDVCSKEIADSTKLATVLGKHVCCMCLEKLRKHVDKEYHRVCLGEVPTRRGGYRKLGEIDT